ncbi:hypothetical protein Cgig2_006181 [Carnegiea gigantea]|uniref:Zeta toxin domain-containing protein n=1 Tax=Carnegiea gigantea TaxID=171969 RepID=A0A9Q1L0X8_9CARY|nr:hypothetical protein Cgig2_006181 [Carnegiea gigantea]
MEKKIVPQIDRTGSGRVGRLERFSHYVARQIGFEDPNECPALCKLANDYLKKTEGCESNIYEFFANEPQAEADSLYVKLIEEFDRCILSYFAFNWTQTSLMITQVLGKDDMETKPKLKDIVMAATRKQRFDRVVKNLKVTRVFSTLVEEMKAIGGIPSSSSNGNADAKCTEVMVPLALHQRSPVLLLMGGGMGAGKSTVLKDILKEPFWAGVASNAVVVEADAFKETDVHLSSTNAASSLLVTALNEGRDVIMDGTLSWVPFVEQTIAMARNVHKWRYRMGVGYKVSEDGIITENYWEKVDDEDEDANGGSRHIEEPKPEKDRKPYRIELVGVVCDAYLAVVRGIRRAIMVRRAVRVKSQLQSHKRFASAFSSYCQLVDNARLYSTSTVGGPPRLIGWKDRHSRLLVDPEQIQCLSILGSLNDEAESIYELHTDESPLTHPRSAWKEHVFSPSRPNVQSELKNAISKCHAVTA